MNTVSAAPHESPPLPPYPTRESFSSPRLAMRTLRRAIRASWRATAQDRRAFPSAFRRALHLTSRELYKSEEILHLGLLRREISDAELRKTASRSTMLRIARALNPEPWRSNLENKLTFHRVAEAARLPVPRLLGAWLPGRVSWWNGQPAPAERSAWQRLLERECPTHFVIKPALGGWGQSVSVIERIGRGEFVAADGRKLTSPELLTEMERAGGDGGCLVQERVWNHPEIVRLSGSHYLQTLRIYSLLDARGDPHVLRGSLKVIAGPNWVDNYRDGRSGNFPAPVAFESGRLLAGAAADPALGGVVRVERHPDTGVEIAGFALPFWSEACELVRSLARSFAPLRWAGWDIALTPDGPVAIEGNWNADAPNSSRCVDALFRELKQLW